MVRGKGKVPMELGVAHSTPGSFCGVAAASLFMADAHRSVPPPSPLLPARGSEEGEEQQVVHRK
jgi:hypothetical protein